MAITCSRCKEKQGFMASLGANQAAETYLCPRCEAEIRRDQKEQSRTQRHAAIDQARIAEKDRAQTILRQSKLVTVTTTPGIDGHRITKYLGVESVEFLIGTGSSIFADIASSIADFFGVRTSGVQANLRAAKEHAMNTLKFIAAEKGANAVVAIDLDYTELSGSRIAIIINGTLVRIESIG